MGNLARTKRVLHRHVVGRWEKGLSQRVAFGTSSRAGGHFSGPVSFVAFQASISHTGGCHRAISPSLSQWLPAPFSRLL